MQEEEVNQEGRVGGGGMNMLVSKDKNNKNKIKSLWQGGSDALISLQGHDASRVKTLTRVGLKGK